MTDPLSLNQYLKYYPIGDVAECRIHGRNRIKDGKLPLFYSRSGVEAAVTATEVWVELEVSFSVFEPWIALEINGEFIMRQMLMPGRYALCLFRGMSYGDVKSFFIYRELQPMSDDPDSYLIIKGIYSDGEFRILPKRNIRIEFVGDSISSGEGTYGARYDMDWLPMYMSSSRTYAALIEKEMNADVRIISQGGWGVCCGWNNDRSHNIPSVYNKVCGFAGGEMNVSLGALDEYTADDFQADVVIINLGTNDLSGFDQPPFFDTGSGRFFKLSRTADGSPDRDDLRRIEDAAVDFLQQVRSLYPGAYILWAYGMLGSGLSDLFEKALLRYSGSFDDKNAAFLALPETEKGELGSRQHPGHEAHERAAQILVAHLKERMKGFF